MRTNMHTRMYLFITYLGNHHLHPFPLLLHHPVPFAATATAMKRTMKKREIRERFQIDKMKTALLNDTAK